MSDDLFTPRSSTLFAKWDESKHPRDSKGRWADIGANVAREVGQTAMTAGITALIGAAPGLFSVARSARRLGAVGQGTRREAFTAPYRNLIQAVRRRTG